MANRRLIVGFIILTYVVVVYAKFDMTLWLQRIATWQKKIKEKCHGGCVLNFKVLNGLWETFREPVEVLIDTVGISESLYPGLTNALMEKCVNTASTYNYCEPLHRKEFITCAMPLVQPHLPEIIKLADQYAEAAESMYTAVAPHIEELLNNLKCDKIDD